MKKLTAMLLCLAMVLVMLSGCNVKTKDDVKGPDTSSNDNSASTAADTNRDPIPIMLLSLSSLETETNVIRDLAAKGPCVIVGRCADFILKDRPDTLHIFIHSDMEHRAERIVRLYGETKQTPQKRLQEKDSKRKVYYKHYTNCNWGEAENYDLCLDSGTLGVDKCADIICDVALMP